MTPAEVRDETMCTGRRHRRSCSSLSSCVSIVYLGAGAAGAAAWVPGLRRGCRGCGAPLGELLARHEVALAHDHVEAHVGLAVEEVQEVAVRSPERVRSE